MPFLVEPAVSIQLHEEHKFYRGTIKSIEQVEGKFGDQLKWIIVLDDDVDAWTDDDGTTRDRETWAYCNQRLTLHEKNKFRKYYKGLTGADPVEGVMVDEQEFVGKRVAVMFAHGKKQDGSPKEDIEHLVAEERAG